MLETHVIIMAGGVGSRFWPISTSQYPKQFLDVMGVGRSLIQLTFDRFVSITSPNNIWVVTNRQYVNIVHEQLPNIPMDNIIAEPERRNTAPCIAYAGWKIKYHHPNANIVVTPSDALVLHVDKFQNIVQKALRFTEEHDGIVTLGIQPSRPEIGYGYIKMVSTDGDIHKVESFCEKPTLEVAKQYIEDGCYLWNAGIFIWNIQTLENCICTYIPKVAQIMDQLTSYFYSEEEEEKSLQLFPKCDNISIDYAVMEHYSEIYTIPSDFGWSDLGNWESLYQLLEHDVTNNSKVGNAELFECSNCIVHVTDAEKVILQGLDGYIVSVKNGKILVCKRSEEQRIKKINIE